MLGSEGVTDAVLAALKTELPTRLRMLRDNLNLSTAQLPEPKEWLAYWDGRSAYDLTRTPRIEVACAADSNYQLVDPGAAPGGGDIWQFDYQVQVQIVIIGQDWAKADRLVRRYALALRDSVLALGEANNDDIQFFGTRCTGTMFEPEPASQNTVIAAQAHLAFPVRTLESVDLVPLGTLETFDVTAVAVQQFPA